MSSNIPPPTQPTPVVGNPVSKTKVFLPLVVAAIALVIIISIVYGASKQGTNPLVASCTIGTVGWPSSITLQGNLSSQDCDMFVQQYPQQYYHMTDPASGDTMCEGDLSHRYYLHSPSSYYQFYIPDSLSEVHYIVKSAPDYSAIGSSICSALIGPQSQ